MNSDRLSEYKRSLIVFPRREGKMKKGLIPDTDVKQDVAANTGRTLPRKAAAVETQYAKIDDALKKGNSHSQYRIEWTNARYKGRREKRAADAAAKEK